MAFVCYFNWSFLPSCLISKSISILDGKYKISISINSDSVMHSEIKYSNLLHYKQALHLMYKGGTQIDL